MNDQGQELVTINAKGMSRRRFLQVLGTSSGAAIAGCTDAPSQKIFPYVKPESEAIPGVAQWYRSTCTECSAGCGIQVRTRDGRAVKIEGSKDHPVNRGGLCALGQASLQSLYNPDRVRQPLKKDADGRFVPITWDQALTEVADLLKVSEGKRAFVSGEMSGTLDMVRASFAKQYKVDSYTLDILQPLAVAKASELAFGVYGVPTYRFQKAEVIVNFGADFLETWVSPVEYAKGWAVSRKTDKPIRLVHVEPRLSLTAANADLWLQAAPGTEVKLALAFLKILLGNGKGAGLREETRAQMKALVEGVALDEVAHETGVAKEKIVLVAQYLQDANRSLVLAGGTGATSKTPLPLMVAANFINLVLGNVGETIEVAEIRTPRTSLAKMQELIASMQNGEVKLLFVHESNPAYALPASFGFTYAASRVRRIVSFSTHLDETAKLANLVLPASTSLESWGDVRERGISSLIQPVMRPVFDTKSLGDILIDLAKSAGKSITQEENFEGVVRAQWAKVHSISGDATPFEKWWDKCVEHGGHFNQSEADRAKVKVDSDAYGLSYASVRFEPPYADRDTKNTLVLYPYFSVRAFDGRAANRPWLQELPDVITKAVWDSWVEIHPDTAKKFGIAQGDLVTLRNFHGEITAAAYLTPHVHKDVVASPIGQGHTSFGRYADGVGANVLNLLSSSLAEGTESLAFLSSRVEVIRARGRADLCVTQGSDSQLDRELARTKKVTAASLAAAAHGHDHHGDDHGHHGHHEPKQMYTQREHPLYSWALAVDLAACTGCSACVVACYAENNIPVVGKTISNEGRELSWLRLERYYDGTAEELSVSFLPMMCQHCHNAPCEPVCPVYATYHNEEGLNAMLYNRCVGTRYCSNNCSYKVRRFNWYQYEFPEPLTWQLNPDVTPRTMGVMEKCTFCVQRISDGKDRAKDLGRQVLDGEIQPACVQSCPTEALTFGNLNDPNSQVSKLSKSPRSYKVLDHHLNTQPGVVYLDRVKFEA